MLDPNHHQNESRMNHALDETLECWRRMQSAEMDSAEAFADRFEASFYTFIDEVKAWYQALVTKPSQLEDLLELPPIAHCSEHLPGPLQLNFETELEYILDGITRIDDEKYD